MGQVFHQDLHRSTGGLASSARISIQEQYGLILLVCAVSLWVNSHRLFPI